MTSEVSKIDLPSIDLPADLSRMLCALRYGWLPAPFQLGPVKEFRLAGEDASSAAPELRFEGAILRATLRSSEIERENAFRLKADVDFCGVLVGGATFNASRVLHRELSVTLDPTKNSTVLTYDAEGWLLLDGIAPSLWVGAVEGMGRIPFGGNLVVERPGPGGLFGGQRCNFRFSGNYVYYLVQGTGTVPRWHMVVDTAGLGVPDGELLGRDFLVLQFVLGRQLRMPLLAGLDGNLKTVAATVGSAIRSNLEATTHPPVPLVRGNSDWVDDCWTAPFFEKIATKWKQSPELRLALWLALDMYLDAMTNHLDWDYMRLHVALESFAFWLGTGGAKERKSEVRDKKAWRAWVKANEELIRGHAVEGRANALYGKVMGASSFSSGRVVPEAFEVLGIELTAEMETELEGRDAIVHRGAMVSDGQYDADREVRRVSIVRTMLAALVASAVGYRGAINGWDLGDQGWPVEASGWWSVDKHDQEPARRTYVARG